MSSTVAQSVQQAKSAVTPAVAGKGRRISWEDFKRKYLSREDGYKYEWVNGAVEKTKRSMDKTHPVLPGFALPVSDILKKPAKP